MANDGYGLFINPAGLTELKFNNYTSTYNRQDAGITYTSLGAALPNLFNGTVGLGFRNRIMGGVQASTEVVDFTDQEILLSFSRQLKDNFSWGGDLRFISQGMSKDIPSYEGAVGSGTALDVSLKYSPFAWLGLGVVLQNIGGRMVYKDQSTIDLATNLILGSSLKFPDREIYANLDFNKEGEEPILGHFGLEWWPAKMLALRGGYNNSNLTAGLGLKVSGVTIDYAMYPTIGETLHYFSVGYVGPDTPATTESKPLELKHFSDVPEGYWTKQPIEYLTTIGLLNWYPDGTFRPEQPISRAETVTLLVNAKDYPQPKEKTQVFPDVPLSFWAAGAIQTAYENKLTIGYPDGDFKPRNNTTRAEAATFLVRFEKLPLKRTDEPPFSDLTKSHWAIREVLAAKEDGLLNYLKDNPFLPSQSLTRAELAEVLYRTKYVQAKLK